MTTFTSSIPRSIKYDRESRDYLATVDGNSIGYFPSYLKAEEACDDHVADLLSHGLIGEPDAGSCCPNCDDELCAACRENNEPPFADVCPSCGDQLEWEGPGLCAACQEAQLTCPQLVALAVNGPAELPAPVGIILDIEHPRELFYRLWREQGYATKAPDGATCTVEVCATCQCLLSHVPFSRLGSYRLFAYCETCDKAAEV